MPTPDIVVINAQNAGYFSELAYDPIADSLHDAFFDVKNSLSQLNFPGWTELTTFPNVTKSLSELLAAIPGNTVSAGVFANQFRVFTNGSQIVFAFKGSSALSNWIDDLKQSGGSAYQSLEAVFQTVYNALKASSQYGSMQIIMDGHSLGGGLAQSFALATGSQGFGQNSLPISSKAQTLIPSEFGQSLAVLENNYAALESSTPSKGFVETNTDGDIASLYYAKLGGQYYLDPHPTTLPNASFGNLELAAAAAIPFSPGPVALLELLTVVGLGGAAHMIGLNTRISQNYSVGTDGHLVVTGGSPNGFLANDSITASPSGVLITDSSGDQIQVQSSSSPSGAESLSLVSGGLVEARGTIAIDPETGNTVVESSGAGNAFYRAIFDPAGDVISATSRATDGATSSITVASDGDVTSVETQGTGSDAIFIQLPAATSTLAETIDAGSGMGSISIANGSGQTSIGGGITSSGINTWSDAAGTQYVFTSEDDSATGTLVISGGVLAASSNPANSITIDDFNLGASHTANGFLGLDLPEQIALTASADAGVDPPAPNFQAGSNQSYTLSVDAPSTSAQTFTVQLTGAPPSTFDALIGNTLTPITNGTFSVVLPAGETNVSFALENLTGFAATNLSLSASMPNLSNPSGSPISAAPLSFEYLGAPSTGSIVADAMYGFSGSPGYFADYPAYVPGILDLQRNASLVGATVALGSVTGDSFVWVNNANTSVVAAGDNDTILAEYGWPYGAGGTDIIAATGHHDVIENDSGLYSSSGPVQIFASGLESLATAITAAQTGTGTGQQGDLIVGGSEANTTIVGSNGNDFITNASGNDVVVAGAGNDVIVGGVKSIYSERYWGEFGENPLEAPDASLIGSFGWQATVTNGNLQIGGGLIDVGDYPGANPDPAYPSTYVPAPANYEGNYDIYGNIVGLGNETIFGGTGASLILLSNGNNYVDVGPGNSTVRGGMGSNTVIGGSGAQFIAGGGGSDYLTAGSGNSTIGGNGGNNTIIGGSGVDLLEAGGGGPNFATVETGDNYVSGGSGSGTIFGSGGADTLIGGTGKYTIFGGAGLELITGGSGNDLLIGGAGNDTIDAGGSGADSIQANGSSSSTSYLYGGDGSDSILGGSGANIIYAGDGGVAGAATSVFASGSDATATTTIYGGQGVDQLVGGSGTAVIYAGDGGSSSAPTSVFAGSGATTIYGGIATDYLQGSSGIDLIYAGDGGVDSAPTTVQAGSGASTIYGGAGSDLLEDVSSGNVSMIAGTGDTTVIGSGSDSVQAGSGNDFIQSNGGSITLQVDGAIGNDTVISNGGSVNLSFGTGVDSPACAAFAAFDSSNHGDLILSVEGGELVIEGGLTGTLGTINFADSGPVSVQQLVQSEGSDETLAGATGNLVFNVDTAAVVEGGTGGSGAVTVSAWGNNDTVFGGNSGQIDVTGSATTVYDSFTVASSSTTATGANDTVQASNSGDNILISGANAVAMGGGSNDTLTATGSNDTLVAGLGNDVFGINASTLIENPFSRGIDTIDSSISYTAPTGINALTLTGSANLVATGNSASDLLTGGAGADTLIAGSGVATLTGGSGNTTFVINSSSDVVRDNFSATNSIQSSVSFTLPNDVNLLTLNGTANLIGAANSANDTLVSNSGIDTLIGGSGHDTFILNSASDVVQDSLGTATIIYQSSGSFTLPAGVTALTLTGTAAIHATGNASNDSITANSGADSLSAGNGTDTLVSGSGIDSLIGGSGNDLFVVNNSADVVLDTSATAANSIQSSVSYTLPTNVNSLLLIGSGNISGTGNTVGDVLTAGAGPDTLTAGSAIDTLIAGTGNTTFVINNLGDVIRESSTTTSNTVDSSVSYSLATDINSLILTGTSSLVGTANAANDSLTGNSGASTLIGGAGVDTLVAGAGVNTLVGGAGNTTFVVNNAADHVVDTSTTATNIAMSSVSYSLPTNVNNLILTGTAALTGIANSFSDSLVGNAGADSLLAGSGFDILVAGSGVDTLVAGTGPDYLVVNSTADVLQIGAGHGVVTVEASLNYTLPTNVATLQLIGTANLTGTGTAASGNIIGNAGRDSLISGTGFETLTAGFGIDTLIGSSAGDAFVINNALDVVVPSVSALNNVYSSVSYTLPTNINALTLGPGNIVGTGNAASDGLVAGAGNDTLVPGTGAANMFGGGDTTFIVNNTTDVVQEQSANAQDTVQSAINFTLPNNVNTLLFTGTAALVGTANAGNDTLIANSGVDTLIGGSGNDTFVVGRAGEILQDSSSGSSNTVQSSVSFSLLTNINTLILSGSSNLVGTANSGADTLIANAGIDTLNGGSGNDVFVINNAADAVSDTSGTTSNSLQTSVNYTLPTNINALLLTGNANIVGTGNGSANTLTGGVGNDTLVAGSGVATLIGGTGNTSFVVNNASDVVQDTTTYSANTIVSSATFTAPVNVNTLVLTGTANLAATANAGNDTLVSNSGVDTLTGGAGASVFVVNNSADKVQDASATSSVVQSSVSFTLGLNLNSLILSGTSNLVGSANSANDTLTSNAGIDTLYGGSGNDTFVINNSADSVQDTSATANNLASSSVNYSLATNVNSLLLTGSANISGQGNTTNDTLTGGAGADTLIAGSGLATLVGGKGNTTFVLNNASDVVQDTQAGSNNSIQSSVSYSAPSNVNTLVLTGTAALKGTANGGNDTLVSNSGLDTLVGGSGIDLFFINNAADVVSISGVFNDSIESSVSYSLQSNINNLILAGSSALVATANGSTDSIYGNAGNDTFNAGAGNDTFIAGSGNNTFVVNNFNDVIVDSLFGGSSSVQSSASFDLPANVDTLTFTGSSNLEAIGNADSSNVLTANSGNDVLIGKALANTINGGNGSDTIEAGPGSNLIYSGNGGTTGAPTLVFGNASGTNISTQTTMYGGSGVNVLYGGPGSDAIYAGSGTSSLISGSGTDTLYGSASGQTLQDSLSGNAVLVAGAGSETLYGTNADQMIAGSGNDLFLGTGNTGLTYEFNSGFAQDSISGGTGTVDNLVFGAGIEASAVTITAANFQGGDPDSLLFSTGTSSVMVQNALLPGVVGSVTFADTGTESLVQLINADGPGTQTLGNLILSTGNNKNVAGTSLTGAIFGYGDNDTLAAFPDIPFTTFQTTQIYAYGNNNVISAGAAQDAVFAYGNADIITDPGDYVTVVGANDTIKASSGYSNAYIYNYQSSTVIQASAGTTGITLNSFASYTLPSNIQTLVLQDSDLVGTSNAQGGSLTANGSNDTLIGATGNDTLSTDGLFNSLVGGSGTDLFVVGSVTDTIVAGSNPGLDTIDSSVNFSLPTGINNLIADGYQLVVTGNNANDSLSGGINGNDDTIIAGSGNDTLNARYGFQTLVGGSGTDTFLVDFSGDVVQESAIGTNSVIQSSVSFTLPTNVNVLQLTGVASAVAAGNAGNDLLTSNSGNDTLIAGTGSDTLQGGSAGGDTFVFNAGFTTDQIINAQNGDAIQFGAGITQASLSFTALPGTGGAAPSLVIAGDGGSVTIQGGLVPGVISGVTFNGGGTPVAIPQLVAPSGRVTVTGTSGNLILSPNNNDTVTGGSGQDTIDAWGNNDVLTAGTGGALIYAGGNLDSVTGGSSSDTLVAIGSTDTLVGGSGNETLVVNSPSTIVTVSAGIGHDTVLSSVSYTVPTNVTVMTLTGANNLAATGNAGADLITANSGNDTLTAGSGVDTLVGGLGNDLFVLNSASDAVQNAYSTADTVQSSASYSLSANVNTLVLTGTSNLAATANAGADTLIGNTGADTLTGGSGPDSLVSGTGNVTLISGTGIDTLVANTNLGVNTNVYVINNSADVIQDSAVLNPHDSTVESSVNYVLRVQAGTLALTGSGNLSGEESSGGGDALIIGNSGNDTLIGIGAFDTLMAGSGIDTLEGTTAYTIYVVNNAADVIIGSGQANGMVQAAISYTLPAFVDTLQLTGSANLVGQANNDASATVNGNTGHDTLVAGSGQDTLNSRIGSLDTLVSGTGNDSFNGIAGNTILLNPGFASDTIYSGTSGVVEFGAGISAGNLSAQAVLDSFGSPAIRITDGTESAVLDFALSGTAYQFNFNGAPNLSLGQFLSQVTVTTSSVTGASGNAILEGTASTLVTGGTGSDTIYAAGAHDSIVGGSGHQGLYAVGANQSVTGGSGTDSLSAYGAGDTLIAGTAVDTLIGGTGASVAFVINNTSDVVQLQASPGVDTLSSSVSYSLPTNLNTLLLTGTAAIKGTANNGTDTLISSAAVETLVGGTGADLFVINNASDIVTVGSTHGIDTIQSSVSFSASANVANLLLTGTSALSGTGNSLAGTLTANSGADTLTAGSGADTLVGGTGTDTFVVNSASDVVKVTATGTADTVSSSASYTVPTNVAYLNLTGTSALTATGNTITDLILGNTGKDTLVGGTGIAALEGGRTAGSDLIKASSNQAALIAGGASSTLTGGAFKDFYAAGLVSDTITTGATANVVSINKGDGADALQPTTGAANILSLGAGIDTESLFFTKTANNLILTDGVSGDSITFTNWYAGASDQDFTTLQVVEIASANYNSMGSDGLRNKALEAFNFTSLVAAYNLAGSPANWALSAAMPSAQLASSSTADFGGDLAYYFGLNGNLTGVDLSAVSSTLTNASFGTATQTIDAFSGISGGGGLHLSVVNTGPSQLLTNPPISGDNVAVIPSSRDDATIGGDRLQSPKPFGNVSESFNIAPSIAGTPWITQRFGIQAPVAEASTPNPAAAPSASTILGSGSAGIGPDFNTLMSQLGDEASANSALASFSALDDRITPRFGIPFRADDSSSILKTITPNFGIEVRPDGHIASTLTVSAGNPTTGAPIDFRSVEPVVPTATAQSILADSPSVQTPLNVAAVSLADDGVLTSQPNSRHLATEEPTASQTLIGTTTIKAVTAAEIAALTSSRPGPAMDVALGIGSFLAANHYVDATNVAWLTMHGALDDANETGMSGAESTTEHESPTNGALLAAPPLGLMRRNDEPSLTSLFARKRAM